MHYILYYFHYIQLSITEIEALTVQDHIMEEVTKIYTL